jgi:hypothetical protein
MGVLLVVLSLGLASIQVALGLYYLIQEQMASIRRIRLGQREQLLYAVSPIVVAWLVAEWLAINDIGSFANLLGLLGALALPVISGLIPILLLLATRRKGEFVPAILVEWLGHPITVALLIFFFIGSIFLHSLLLWDSGPSRLFALVGGVLILAATLTLLRRGALTPRTVLGLHVDESFDGGGGIYTVQSGQPYPVTLGLDYRNRVPALVANDGNVPTLASLRQLRCVMAMGQICELKVWGRRTTVERQIISLVGSLVVSTGSRSKTYDLETTGGQVVVPVAGEECEVKLELFEN